MVSIVTVEKVEEHILDLQDDLKSIIVEVWDTMNERVKEKDFKTFRGRLRFGQYEPHIYKVFQDILLLPSVKNIDNFFDKIRPCINFVDIGLLIKLVNTLKSGPALTRAIKFDLPNLTPALLANGLISPHTEEVTCFPGITDTEKANTILADVRNQIERYRNRYSLFFESLNSPDCKDGRKTLEEELQAARRELRSPEQGKWELVEKVQ